MTDPLGHLSLANPRTWTRYIANTHIHLHVTYIYTSHTNLYTRFKW